MILLVAIGVVVLLFGMIVWAAYGLPDDPIERGARQNGSGNLPERMETGSPPDHDR